MKYVNEQENFYQFLLRKYFISRTRNVKARFFGFSNFNCFKNLKKKKKTNKYGYFVFGNKDQEKLRLSWSFIKDIYVFQAIDDTNFEEY